MTTRATLASEPHLHMNETRPLTARQITSLSEEEGKCATDPTKCRVLLNQFPFLLKSERELNDQKDVC